jgi:hypothetical protein
VIDDFTHDDHEHEEHGGTEHGHPDWQQHAQPPLDTADLPDGPHHDVAEEVHTHVDDIAELDAGDDRDHELADWLAAIGADQSGHEVPVDFEDLASEQLGAHAEQHAPPVEEMVQRALNRLRRE